VGDGFEITGVQLERSTVVTAFQRNAGTIQGELYACKYYYNRFGSTAAAAFNGTYYSTTSFYGVLNFPTMRVAPAFAVGGGTDALDVYRDGAAAASTGIFGAQITTSSIEINVTTGASTAGDGGFVRFKTTGSPYLEFSSEL
jgi:hypothetical protein